jgi:hypothetical protein
LHLITAARRACGARGQVGANLAAQNWQVILRFSAPLEPWFVVN